MNTQPADKQVNYDVILPSELPHYMTLEEMHERLTEKIKKHYSQQS